MTQHDYSREVDRALDSDEPVTKADYLRWASSGHLPTEARACALSASSWDRIQPEPSMEEQCSFMKSYFLGCIERNPSGDNYLHGGCEAGHALAGWLKHLHKLPGTESIIAGVASSLGELYVRLDSRGRSRVETGALEHILEAPELRGYFGFWRENPTLRKAYESALEWGLAHTEQTG